MGETNYMNREELLKLAALDVFGLLEEFESELFNRSYHNAPASVQDEIAALQAEISADPIFLSDDKPAATLRERVLERVARAVEEEAAKLAPLATIGRGRGGAAADPAAVRSLARSALIWRLTSFALAACLLITLGLLLDVTRSAQDISRLALEDVTSEELREMIGPDFEHFVNSPSTRAVFRPTEDATTGIAAIWMNDKSNQVFVLGLDLAKGNYRLQARADDGTTIDVSEFRSDGPIASARVDRVDLAALGVTSLSALTWEILDSAGNLVLTTA